MYTVSQSRLNRAQQNILKFQSKRRTGDYTRIANNTFYSVGHVQNVLVGRRSPNSIIVNEANRVIANR